MSQDAQGKLRMASARLLANVPLTADDRALIGLGPKDVPDDGDRQLARELLRHSFEPIDT